ncbi:autotransporter domain-containing protein [Bosea sp. NBC_00550]|uniref:autotransporter domain-containing protein n=1 Tax=Bosea sp. NBC_00550 TaxID=2969621 RepID=UPI0022328B2E|nr:autotransporter domain-containing protein [Bosea sp. NBC_00550]UZF95592.1 autotransporter domain-containing protein [Bosea sp. NBC_00550]
MTRLGPINLAAAGSYDRLDNDVSRAVPELGNTLLSSYVTAAWSGRTQASAKLASSGGFTLSPLAARHAVTVLSPAFNERGLRRKRSCSFNRRSSTTTSRSGLGAQLDAEA